MRFYAASIHITYPATRTESFEQVQQVQHFFFSKPVVF
jgi:hypothetical protein